MGNVAQSQDDNGGESETGCCPVGDGTAVRGAERSAASGRPVPRSISNVIACIAGFCHEELDEEYLEVALRLARTLERIDPALRRGRPESWAAGIIHAVGWVNLLTDPATSPYLTSREIATSLGVSETTMHEKSRRIRQRLDLVPLSPPWCLPSLFQEAMDVWASRAASMVYGEPAQAMSGFPHDMPITVWLSSSPWMHEAPAAHRQADGDAAAASSTGTGGPILNSPHKTPGAPAPGVHMQRRSFDGSASVVPAARFRIASRGLAGWGGPKGRAWEGPAVIGRIG
ncbi:MAG: hypothetical protein KF817_14550 [Phycisphaeraceae bacterium]|nr:hypothetical protein [Phycisphaeraceae bacterium]